MQLQNILIAADIAVISAYPEMDADRLAMQLAMMRRQNWQVDSVDDIATKLASAQSVVRSMFDPVEQLVRLLLTIPCSSAEAERSFSSLRRLKTYLRSSMSQQRLNHLAVLHVHRDRLYSIDIDVITREFVAKPENRLATFGRI